jgi:hypothetical protein
MVTAYSGIALRIVAFSMVTCCATVNYGALQEQYDISWQGVISRYQEAEAAHSKLLHHKLDLIRAGRSRSMVPMEGEQLVHPKLTEDMLNRYRWCDDLGKCQRIAEELSAELRRLYPGVPEPYLERARRVLEELPPSVHLSEYERVLALGYNERVGERARARRKKAQHEYRAGMAPWDAWRKAQAAELEESHRRRVAAAEESVHAQNDTLKAIGIGVAAAALVVGAALNNNGTAGYSTPPSSLYQVQPSGTCCKICDVGKPCGNTCISSLQVCHLGPGCACSISGF